MPDVEHLMDSGHVRSENSGQHPSDSGTAHLETADQQAPETGMVQLTAELLPADPNTEAVMQSAPEAPPVALTARRRRRSLLVAACLLLVFVAAAAVALLWPRTDSEYLKALKTAGLAGQYANDDVAIAHAQRFCRDLQGGHSPQGYKADRLAVEFYCPSFLTGFKVVPTPSELQDKYLKSLRDGGFGGRFASDAAAVAHAKSACDTLRKGGKQQGLKVDEIGVQVYCPEFAAGFHVLQTITVKGTFALIDSDPSYYYPSIVAAGGRCAGSNGYDDIHAGTTVLVKRGSGSALARTSLRAGKGHVGFCEFPFQFKVTEGEDDYVVSVGRRGDMHYTFAELQNDGVELSLGN